MIVLCRLGLHCFVTVVVVVRSASGRQLQQIRHYKTCWPKLQTNTIFSSHFKDISRNSELQIERLVAKGSYGVVFQVTTRDSQKPQEHRKLVPLTRNTYALKVLKKSQVMKPNDHYYALVSLGASHTRICFYFCYFF